MINIRNIVFHFGGLKAVDGVNVNISKGTITGLIGPNGAGKSTLFNLIAGLLEPLEGSIWLDGHDVTGLKPHQLFSRGLLRTFQIAHEFPSLTVRENLMMVPDGQTGEALVSTWLNRAKVASEEKTIRRKADEVIDFLNLSHLAEEPAGNLSGGQKKLLELGRTMMVDAKVVLLDEVGAGVNRTLLNDIGDTIVRLNSECGYTFCMIEHDISFISKLCNPVIVMAEGKILMQGTPTQVKSDETVIEAYLGASLKT